MLEIELLVKSEQLEEVLEVKVKGRKQLERMGK